MKKFNGTVRAHFPELKRVKTVVRPSGTMSFRKPYKNRRIPGGTEVKLTGHGRIEITNGAPTIEVECACAGFESGYCYVPLVGIVIDERIELTPAEDDYNE